MLSPNEIRLPSWSDHGVDQLEVHLDPFVTKDCLQELLVVDTCIDARTSITAVLFDMRGSLQYRGPENTGLLVAKGVQEVEWNSDVPEHAVVARSVVGSSFRRDSDGHCLLEIVTYLDSRLVIKSSEAWFVVGTADQLPEAPPDYSEDYVRGRRGEPSWDYGLGGLKSARFSWLDSGHQDL